MDRTLKWFLLPLVAVVGIGLVIGIYVRFVSPSGTANLAQWLLLLLVVMVAIGLVLAFYVGVINPQSTLLEKMPDVAARVRELGGEEGVVALFQQRKRRFLWAFLGCVLGLALIFFFAPHRGLNGPTVLGTVIFGVSVAYMGFVYRCPICGRPPFHASGGVAIDPDTCDRCGVSLR